MPLAPRLHARTHPKHQILHRSPRRPHPPPRRSTQHESFWNCSSDVRAGRDNSCVSSCAVWNEFANFHRCRSASPLWWHACAWSVECRAGADTEYLPLGRIAWGRECEMRPRSSYMGGVVLLNQSCEYVGMLFRSPGRGIDGMPGWITGVCTMHCVPAGKLGCLRVLHKGGTGVPRHDMCGTATHEGTSPT
ncbi:hypothetical protein BDV95DRAFT_360398 [Massariosphaeria phaeospora]|uniref:Uncharacterized protein n=1 Tax=Massariosphaeria phaeospora TaxID=100035 RepID=A0A7C8IBF1_9PLEO|nr:hypothetical protein BDV95DRAFT_360398 [Massariosphaeria phaeospora]